MVYSGSARSAGLTRVRMGRTANCDKLTNIHFVFYAMETDMLIRRDSLLGRFLSHLPVPQWIPIQIESARIGADTRSFIIVKVQ